MKGKSFSVKLLITAILILVASFCVTLGTASKTKNEVDVRAAVPKVLLGAGSSEEEYSALFDNGTSDGGVVFSVEKVQVSSAETDGKPNGLTGGEVKTFLGHDDEEYDFINIKNGTLNKHVVEDGKFVRLNNVNRNGNIYINNIPAYQEAIMVSFGAYVYDVENDEVEISDQSTIFAGITFLEVVAKRDGLTIDVPDIRNIRPTAGGLFFDFVHLITQENNNSNEGFYQYDFRYYVNNVEKTASFEFYIVNDSSYTQQANPEGKIYGYNAYPTLGWVEGSDFEHNEINNYVEYKIGEYGITSTDLAYPTITYDYTRYTLRYVHNANNKNTTYVFTPNLTMSPAKMFMSVTSSGISYEREFLLPDYDRNSGINLATIMLSESGTYNFTSEYLYRSNPDIDMGFGSITKKLSINGLSANYSKVNVESAKLQYFEIAKTTEPNKVDVITPNGFRTDEDLSKFKDQKIGFVYDFVENNTVREGNILLTNTIDSLINAQLKNSDKTSSTNDYDFLTSNINNIKSTKLSTSSTEELKTNINNVLVGTDGKKIKYAQTNQGSISLDGNDTYVGDSFYFYGSTPIDFDVIKNNIDTKGTSNTDDDEYGLPFTNTTTFNTKGYYLVFLNVSNNGTDSLYWQIFAFQYTSSSVDIKVDAVKDDKNNNDLSDDEVEVLANGKYTNNKVRISWLKPGIFDRSISSYYFSKSANVDKDLLMKETKNKLNTLEFLFDGHTYVGCYLGESVADNTFVKFLIRLESEGDTATHKIFTIDKQDISGITPWLVQEMNFGNSSYYAFATDVNGNKIPLNYSITDGYATLTWDNKASGAEIFAEYSYITFDESTLDPTSFKGNNSKEWITTKYELGSLVLGTDLFKPNANDSRISDDCVIYNQGIYLISLKDSAGNKCDYVMVIDRTNSFFKIDDKYLSNSSIIFGNNVEYSVGDYKVFNLNVSSNTVLNNYIKAAASGTLSQIDEYYQGSTTNANNLSNIFQKFGNDYYLTVANSGVVAFENNTIDNSISGIKGQLTYSESASTYYKRTLYSYGINHKILNSNDIKDGAYVIVEINKDNSRSYVYYSNNEIQSSNIPTNGIETTSMFRLDTGSDSETNRGIEKASATKANHIAFTWKMGSGNFVVGEVKYSYYTLTPTTYNDDTYFYALQDTDVNVYKNNTFGTNAGQISSTDNGYLILNGNSDTKSGLYVVTRIYNSAPGADLGDDVKEKNYYFIVDRNGIIDVSANIGNEIKITLMETETYFNQFSTQTNSKPTFSYIEDNIDRETYNVYLTTSKLPASLVIPTGKYYINENKTSSEYYAGRLNVSVYFKDTENNLSGKYQGSTVKIFEEYGVQSSDKFNIDIYKYLSNVNINLRDRLTVSDEHGNWIFLPGIYIVRITDNVLNGSANKLNNVKNIGLEISVDEGGPEIDAYNGAETNSMNEISITKTANNTYEATVSQEFLKVVLPKYDKTEYKTAQVDPGYIVVTQYYGNQSSGTNYINHQYKVGNDGINLTNNSEIITINDDGSIDVWLDTKLKIDGVIDYENLNTPLYYTIKVRYKLNNLELPYGTGVKDRDARRYEDCYVYYNGNTKVYYYESTYTIKIDREAPKNNINYLNKNDSLVEEYNTEFGTSSMIESGIHSPGSSLYFTKQYAKYYQEKAKNGTGNSKYIYVYQVQATTEFSKDDISVVYYKEIVNLATASLELPLTNAGSYTAVNISSMSGNTYSSISGLTAGNYYEIIEQDFAGNTTQYVIHYEPQKINNGAEIQIPVKVTNTVGNEIETTINFDYDQLKNEPIYIYNINGNGTTAHTEYFFKIEIKKASGEKVLSLLTNPATNFEELTNTIVNKVKENYGSYIITITTRTSAKTTNLIIYSIEDLIKIDIEKLVEKDGENYKINLKGANESIEKDGNTLIFFAKEITVNGNVYTTNDSGLTYQMNGAGQDVSYIACGENTTYSIQMVDIFGNVSKYRFNTSGLDFVVINFEEFGEDGGENYYKSNQGTDIVYYGFTTATFKYDPNIYSMIILKKSNGTYGQLSVDEHYEAPYKMFDLHPTYDETLNNGGLSEYKIELYYDGELEIIYFITLDSRLSDVALRDVSTGEQKDIIKIFNNTKYDNSDVRADKVDSGTMNLQWSEIEENNYFDYNYTLYELLKDKDENENDVYKITNLNGEINQVIATNSNSTGIYKFEITVLSKDGYILGNRLFVFEVEEISNQIYYVRDENNVALRSNSTFQITDVEDYETKIQEKFGKDESENYKIKENINYPLFVTNQNLEVIVAVTNVNQRSVLIKSTTDYTFTIYEISKENAYEIYVGILKFNNKLRLVSGVKIETIKTIVEKNENKETFEYADVDENTTFMISGNKDTKLKILSSTYELSDKLLLKNKTFIEVSYGNTVVSMEEFNGNYEVLGNGKYSFAFKDLAGYVHMFNNGRYSFEVDVVREVVITLNDHAPIENGYYNDAVSLVIYESSKYTTGSISIKATRNGVDYQPEGYNPYVFSDYGTYRVVISAKHPGVDEPLTKVTTFTILNVKEARKSIDLTNLAQYKITSVKNQLGQDITNKFLEIANMKDSGYNISYEMLMANADKLNITTGKQTFTLSYEVEDKIYPKRNVEFSFTLNNEDPKISCSLEKGESTKKSFKIYYNAAVIYEKVGESYIYINDILVEHITEDSANIENEYVISYKEHGDGDYYVKIVSTSDVILDSFKVTIKEPLNTWAIIVIIVVVGVITTVVVTIVVLRRKMRIR